MLVVAAILTTVVLGIPLTLAIDRRAHGIELVALAWLYGSGLIWAVMLALSVAQVRWSALLVTLLALAISGATWFIARRMSDGAPATAAAVDGLPIPQSYSIAALVVDILTLYTVVSYTFYATLARVWEWDFWAIWGLKARVFVEAAGIDWRFLRSPFNDFCHPDYPLLLPLNYAYAALLGGGWNDRWLALIGVAYGIALLLIVRSHASRDIPQVGAAALTFAATAFALSYYVGLAEAPMIAFGSAAILFVRRGMMFDDSAALTHGAILLGLAASTKNEGLALIAAVAAAIVMADRSRWRRVLQLWPAVAIVLPWTIARTALHLQTDIARGALVERALDRLGQAGVLLGRLIANLPDAWLWMAILAGILIIPGVFRKKERFVFIAVAVQLLFFVAAYVVTPHDLEWHIQTSWPRLVRQIGTPLLFIVGVSLVSFFVAELRSARAATKPADAAVVSS